MNIKEWNELSIEDLLKKVEEEHYRFYIRGGRIIWAGVEE